MGWKDWSYWLRGGMVSVMLLVIITILLYFSGLINIVKYVNQCLIPPCSSSLHFYLFSWDFLQIHEFIAIVIVSVIIFFIFGAIIGWIYGKINGKKT